MIKKLLLNIAIFFNYLMRGLNSADKLSFGPKEDSLSGGVDITKHIEQNTVWDALLRGEVTQEVKELRHQTYEVNKESKNFEYVANGKVIKKNKLSEDHVYVDESDNIPIQIIQNNELIPQTILDELEDVNSYGGNKEKYTLEISRDFIPRFKLEEFVNKLVVKRLNEREVQLDFYSSIYQEQFNKRHRPYINEMNKIVNGFKQSDIIDFNNVKFVSYKAFGSEDSLLYSYDNIKFKEAIIFDGNFVLKFNANIKSDGIDLTHKFYDEKMSKKYMNKETKGIAMVGWTPNMSEEEDYDIKEAEKLKNKLLNGKID